MTKATKLTIPGPEHAAQGARLVNIYPAGSALGSCFTLTGDTVATIGRDPECDIFINDKSVSRKHARIQSDGAGHTVLDLNSLNGTFVNRTTRVTSHMLKDGDYLHVGNAIFRYLAGGNLASAYHEEIYRLTIIDGLTEIHNKRFLLEFLERELVRSARYSRPLTLVMIDVDHFKKINDEMGHLAGDFALRELASIVRDALRKEDLLARYGGEEFALVMPETALEKALPTVERVRRLVEVHPFSFDNHSFQVTISAGLSTTTGDTTMTVTELIRQADDKLYQAKQEGRNRVVT